MDKHTQLRLDKFAEIAVFLCVVEEGSFSAAASRHVVDAMAKAENSVSPPDQDVIGVLHVHTSLTFAQHHLAPLLPCFLKRHPRLRIEFIIGTDRGDFLKKGIDVAIHSGRPTELSLVGKPLFQRRWMVATRHNEPSISRRRPGLDQHWRTGRSRLSH